MSKYLEVFHHTYNAHFLIIQGPKLEQKGWERAPDTWTSPPPSGGRRQRRVEQVSPQNSLL